MGLIFLLLRYINALDADGFIRRLVDVDEHRAVNAIAVRHVEFHR